MKDRNEVPVDPDTRRFLWQFLEEMTGALPWRITKNPQEDDS